MAGNFHFLIFATLHRICIVEENFSGYFSVSALQRKYKPSENNPLYTVYSYV